jgi:hypothetical protein
MHELVATDVADAPRTFHRPAGWVHGARPVAICRRGDRKPTGTRRCSRGRIERRCREEHNAAGDPKPCRSARDRHFSTLGSLKGVQAGLRRTMPPSEPRANSQLRGAGLVGDERGGATWRASCGPKQGVSFCRSTLDDFGRSGYPTRKRKLRMLNRSKGGANDIAARISIPADPQAGSKSKSSSQ